MTTTTNGTGTPLNLSLDDLVQANADFERRRRERERDKVLVYPGTLDSLKILLAKAGVSEAPMRDVAPHLCSWAGQICLREVPEANLVLIGTQRDVGNVLSDPQSMSAAMAMANAQTEVIEAVSRPSERGAGLL